MLLLWIVIFPSIWSFSSACDKPNEACTVDLNDDNIKILINSSNKFAIKIIQGILKSQPFPTNIILSPMSIWAALVLMVFGSAQNTLNELTAALEFPNDGKSWEQLQTAFGHLLQAIQVVRTQTDNNKKEVTLEKVRLAEGLFIQSGFELVEAYHNFLNSLKLESQMVDFSNNMEDAAKKITDWIAANNPTQGESPIAYAPGEGTQVLILNLMSFSAPWIPNLFSADKKPITFPSPWGPTNVAAMKASASLLYFEYQDKNVAFTSVQLPYAAGDFNAVVVLSVQGSDPHHLAQNFNLDMYEAIVANTQTRRVSCRIPTLKYSSVQDMNAALQDALKLDTFFTAANLSNMLQLQDTLAVTIVHMASIDFNKFGSMAVTLPTEAMADSPAPGDSPVDFTVDRAFLLLIRHTTTNAILHATYAYTFF